MSSRPSVSVVIPVYNGEQFLREAIESVFNQALQPSEIIVVDDCSTDGSLDVAKAIQVDSPVPLRLVRLPANSGGPARPINVGIGQATGDIISVLDQDDVWASDHLATKAVALAARPEVSIVISWFGILGQTVAEPKQKPGVRNAILRKSTISDGVYIVSGAGLLALNIRWGMLLGGYPAFVFRRSDWQRKGGVDESLRIASDFELVGWLLLQGQCAVIPQVGYFRREHDANICRRRADMYVESAEVRVHLLRLARGLRGDRRVICDLRKDLFRMARGFEEAAHYAHAAKMYSLAWRLGWRQSRTALSLAGLPLRRAFRWLIGRQPVHSRYTLPPSESPPAHRSNAA